METEDLLVGDVGAALGLDRLSGRVNPREQNTSIEFFYVHFYLRFVRERQFLFCSCKCVSIRAISTFRLCCVVESFSRPHLRTV